MVFMWKARWPTGQCTGLHIERFEFEPQPWHCVVFLGKTLYSYSVAANHVNAGGNPAMD